jgi:cobalt-zinc-cadmium efflux system protein
VAAEHHHHGHHHHHHAPARFDRAFAIGAALNTGFVLAEIGFGLAANSVALLADAMHNLGDVAALLLSWAAAWLARRPPTPRRSYGWGRFSVLAALINAILLLLAVGAIAWEAMQRLRAPEPMAEITVIWVAAIGIVINLATALMFLRGREHDLNIRAAFLHMTADAAVSAGVVAAAFGIAWTGWLWLDPLTSLAIVVVIAIGSWDLLRQAAGLAMDAVPAAIAPDQVAMRLSALPGVREVHDLHIWGLSTADTALTAHLVHDGAPDPDLLNRAIHLVEHEFGIRHATFQVETPADAARCQLRPHDVV